MTYTHAKDYLIELASNPKTHGWLKDLAIKVINSNGNVSDSELVASTTQLKSNDVSILPVTTSPSINSCTDVKFISLTHHTGVCALAEEQKIIFSKDITLLYGKNGSGKSSYFRIINEIIGGNHRTEIRPNIYANSQNPINIELTYKEETNIKTISWDGTSRAISPLNLSSVFDSSYVETFLQKRRADSAVILPYGLHLFEALTTAMDKIKEKLQTEIDGLMKTLPRINLEGLSDNVVQIIKQYTYSSIQKTYVQNRYLFTEEQNSELITQEKILKELNETNLEDKIQLASNELSLYSGLYKYITETKDNLQKCQKDVKKIIEDIIIAQKANEETKNKIAILKEIGNTDSAEWKAFIGAGAAFAKKAGIANNICPYCRQPILDNAANVVSAYVTYLSDKSLTELNKLLEQKENLIKKIFAIRTEYTIPEQFKILMDGRKSNSSSSLYTEVMNTIGKMEELKSSLQNSLQEDIFVEYQITELKNDLIGSIADICKEYGTKISKLREDVVMKNQKITGLTTAMKPLVERKSISDQKDLFVVWFNTMHSVNKLKKCQSELSTRSISTIAKKANQTLVTDNLKNKFQEELNALGLKKLSVDLFDAGASHGQSFLQLKLINNISVTDILSEGEQKGVALALFIAERRMQLSKCPIIFDDPVNSLDHFITAKLIDRLSSLDNQIIIFSHNLLLQTSLVNLSIVHECGMNQISSCTKDSRHLFMYFVESQGRDKKGVIREMKQDNVRNNLNNAHKLLNSAHYIDDSGIGIGAILRHTIELMIDEKIFMNQIPIKFHGRKNNIPWEQLKTLNPNVKMIDKLNKLFNRLSGGNLHSGLEQIENPIEHDELEDIYNELNVLYSSIPII